MKIKEELSEACPRRQSEECPWGQDMSPFLKLLWTGVVWEGEKPWSETTPSGEE